MKKFMFLLAKSILAECICHVLDAPSIFSPLVEVLIDYLVTGVLMLFNSIKNNKKGIN